MKILTCNIRYFGADDGSNIWQNRKDFCASVIRSRTPDIICFQEMWKQQADDMKGFFPEFDSFGMVDEPCSEHPLNSIFYRRDMFERISAGGHWLSDRPHVTGSKSWDSACIRMVNWMWLVVRQTGRSFRIVNTHIDHVGQTARENQARMIVEDARAYPADYPQILTGDMNCDASNPAIGVYRAGGWIDTYGAIHRNENPGRTYHEFLGDKCKHPIGKMDWIFIRGKIKPTAAEIITDSKDGKYPSDHYFVSATLEL